jgi:hypothetical protein
MYRSSLTIVLAPCLDRGCRPPAAPVPEKGFSPMVALKRVWPHDCHAGVSSSSAFHRQAGLEPHGLVLQERDSSPLQIPQISG